MTMGPKRTNLFLIELVFNLFIFALCAAVCVGLLLHARLRQPDNGGHALVAEGGKAAVLAHDDIFEVALALYLKLFY